MAASSGSVKRIYVLFSGWYSIVFFPVTVILRADFTDATLGIKEH